jgi:hypothetical protein
MKIYEISIRFMPRIYGSWYIDYERVVFEIKLRLNRLFSLMGELSDSTKDGISTSKSSRPRQKYTLQTN